MRLAAALRDEREWAAASGVACALAGVVLRDARGDVLRDAAVQAAVRAARDVHEPRVPHGGSLFKRASISFVTGSFPSAKVNALRCRNGRNLARLTHPSGAAYNGGVRRCALLILLTGCPEAAPPAEPTPARVQPDTSWIKSDKLDPDLQELVLRAYDTELAFPFRVRMRSDDGGLDETVLRVRPADVSGFVRDERVVAVRCATPPTEQVPDEQWRAKVDPDVRTVHGAQSSCWTPLTIRFEREPSLEEWRAAEEGGILVHARDGRSAILWAPVRGIPRLAAMAFVAKIEPYATSD